MKRRLVGGLILLNLCAISLSLSAGEQDITNNDVLDQLVRLREYIDEKRDFTKESKGLKPVLVQYRSSVSKIDGVVECNLSFNTDALHLSIGGYSVQADGTPIAITINVVYEWTEYIGYTIKSAKLNATNELKLAGEQSVKPIYCHPISIDGQRDDDTTIHVTLMIFNNSNVPFDTQEKLITEFNRIFALNNNAVFPVSGSIFYTTGNLTLQAYKIELFNDANVVRFTRPADGSVGYFDLDGFTFDVNDGVNKIN